MRVHTLFSHLQSLLGAGSQPICGELDEGPSFGLLELNHVQNIH